MRVKTSLRTRHSSLRPVIAPAFYQLDRVSLNELGYLHRYPACRVRGELPGGVESQMKTSPRKPGRFRHAIAHGLEWASPVTLGFPRRRSDYEPEPRDQLDYVERVLERFSRDRATRRSAGIRGACCPSDLDDSYIRQRRPEPDRLSRRPRESRKHSLSNVQLRGHYLQGQSSRIGSRPLVSNAPRTCQGNAHAYILRAARDLDKPTTDQDAARLTS
jgi:hypothetical protein